MFKSCMFLRGGGGGRGWGRGGATPSPHGNNTLTLIHGRFKAFQRGGGPLAAPAWTVKTVRSPHSSKSRRLVDC